MLRKLMFLGVTLVAVLAAGLTLSASPARAVPLNKVTTVKPGQPVRVAYPQIPWKPGARRA